MTRTILSLAAAAALSAVVTVSLRAADEPAGQPDRPAAAAPAGDKAPADKPAGDKAPAAGKAADARREIEVCFVLDTTGSMSGLIEGAKQKIWSIANTIIAVHDKPRIKFALVAYRDRGDKYVTQRTDLTDDLDAVFKTLTSFKAEGGGDGPESVNQALNEAVTRVSWSGDDKVAKIVFLVGDAPPHMDYADDVKYADTCAAAAKRGIVINAVQCGSQGETTPVWREIARLGKGEYIPLAQEGGMVAVATPYDKELAELNAQVALTAVAYGNVEQQRLVSSKVAANASFRAGPATSAASAEAIALADRAVYNSNDGRKAIQGGGDLVWACTNGVVRIEDVQPADLPPELQKMSLEERRAYVDRKQKERDALQAKVAELAQKRDAYVAAERAKAAAPAAAAFDEKVSAVVREQAEAKK